MFYYLLGKIFHNYGLKCHGNGKAQYKLNQKKNRGKFEIKKKSNLLDYVI